MRLYHGSDLRIKTVNLAHCMKYRDFGQRFYLSDTFGKLTDTTTGLHAKPWTETYALLKKELGI